MSSIVPTALVLIVAHLSTIAAPAKPGQENPRQAGFTTKLALAYQSKEGEKRERVIYLWYPTEERARAFIYVTQRGSVAPDAAVSEGRHPLVLFSHGFWGGADQSVFLMEALARAGYIVASLHHDDATPNQRKRRVHMPNFVDAKSWGDEKFFDRKEDMTALLDQLLRLDGKPGSLLHKRVKRDAVGAAGHSLGGYTILGLAGARKSWKDERIAAALLLSPYILPYFYHGELGAVKIPVMFQGGTLDVGITPFLKGIYDKLTVPKYYLVLRGANHFDWTDLNSAGRTTMEVLRSGNPKLIAEYSLAFFDQHLRGEDRKEALQKRKKELFGWWAKQ